MLTNELCQPRSLNESKILQKCSYICRYEKKVKHVISYFYHNKPNINIFNIVFYFCRLTTIIFLIVTNISAASVYLTPLIDKNSIRLPVNAWLPYSINSKPVFCLTYIYQSLSVWMAASLTGSFETFTMIIILQVCAQIDIIIERLNMLPEVRKNCNSEYILHHQEIRIIKDFVRHHIHLYS